MMAESNRNCEFDELEEIDDQLHVHEFMFPSPGKK
jgi:hypothetical protein